VNRGDIVEAGNLVTGNLKDGHGRVGAHALGVAFHEAFDGAFAEQLFAGGFAAGHDQRSGHALQIPLEGAAEGLVEVVDVEDQAAVFSSVGAEVADVGIAAELHLNAGGGERREIGSHDRDSAAEVAERRSGHTLVFDLDQSRNAAFDGLLEKGEGAGGAVFGGELGMEAARHLFADRLAGLASGLRRCPLRL